MKKVSSIKVLSRGNTNKGVVLSSPKIKVLSEGVVLLKEILISKELF